MDKDHEINKLKKQIEELEKRDEIKRLEKKKQELEANQLISKGDCPSCGTRYRFNEEDNRGIKIKCSNCNNEFTVFEVRNKLYGSDINKEVIGSVDVIDWQNLFVCGIFQSIFTSLGIGTLLTMNFLSGFGLLFLVFSLMFAVPYSKSVSMREYELSIKELPFFAGITVKGFIVFLLISLVNLIPGFIVSMIFSSLIS